MAEVERTLRPEDEIAHYRIVSPLAKGGMGEVYLAQDRELGRSVALKILPPDLTKDEDRVRRFGLEARSASSLNHPNIVTIYSIGKDPVRSAGSPDSDPVHYISMELVSGKTLATLIHEDKLDLRTLLGYLAQVAEGLAKAHAAGIVHRDLKPGNIMVSADGFAKVLDFGLAKLTEKRESGADLTEDPTLAAGSEIGSVVGTAGYMSPEQVQGKAVDHRSDIFSFGCILYEAATRRKPFAAETGVETMHKILNEKPAPIEELTDKVPGELRRLVRRCLAKSPEQRAQSIKDVAIELREIVEEFDTLSASASSTSHGSGAAAALAPSRKLGAGQLAAAALAAVALVFAAFWVSRRGATAPPAPAPFETMRMSTQTSRGDVFEASISPDGRYLGYLAGTTGRVSMRVRQIATGSDVEVLPTQETGLEGPAFSADGNYLYCMARKPDNPQYRALFEVPSLGGSPRERVFDVDSRVTFSPDGKRIAFWRRVNAEKKSQLVVFDRDASSERLLASVDDPESYQGGPSWSPDGTTLAVALLLPAPEFKATIAFFDTTSGERRNFLELPSTVLNSVAWLADGRGLVASAQDLRRSINQQIYLVGHPDGRLQRVTNDFSRYVGVSVSGGEEAISAVRFTRLANVWVADASGGPARQVTSYANPEESLFGISADGETVFYDGPRDQAVQVFAQPVSGGEPRALTSGTGLAVNPRAAGGVVVFDRLEQSGIHVWAMGLDGSNLRQLTTGSGEQAAAISPDGRYAAFFPFDSVQTVSLVSLASGQVTPIREATTHAGFSPDSSQFLVGSQETDAQGLARTVWMALPVAGGPATATFRLRPTAVEPAWAPDGKGMTYRDRADPSWNVFRQDAGGGPPVPVTRFTEGRSVGYQWSHDGSRIALVRRGEDGGASVWVTASDGSRPVQVTGLPSDVFQLRWLPDGKRVAVSAGKLSRDVILIRKFR